MKTIGSRYQRALSQLHAETVPITAAELAGKLGLPRNSDSISDVLRQLERDGLAKRSTYRGRARWSTA